MDGTSYIRVVSATVVNTLPIKASSVLCAWFEFRACKIIAHVVCCAPIRVVIGMCIPRSLLFWAFDSIRRMASVTVAFGAEQ